MATNVTSLVLTESAIPNRRIRTHAGGFAISVISNPRCASSLVLNSPAPSLHTNLAVLVHHHPAELLKLFQTPKIRFSPRVGRIRDAFGNAGLHHKCGRESALFH